MMKKIRRGFGIAVLTLLAGLVWVGQASAYDVIFVDDYGRLFCLTLVTESDVSAEAFSSYEGSYYDEDGHGGWCRLVFDPLSCTGGLMFWSFGKDIEAVHMKKRINTNPTMMGREISQTSAGSPWAPMGLATVYSYTILVGKLGNCWCAPGIGP